MTDLRDDCEGLGIEYDDTPAYEIKDSGVHHDFNTGSRRDSQEGKPWPDLISPFMLDRLGKHYATGAIKYAERNWELGQPSSQYLRSAFRHLIAYLMGKRDEDHLSAIIWNITGVIHNEELVKLGIYEKSMLDTPDYTSPEGFHQTIKEPALKENQRRKAVQNAKNTDAPESESECSDEPPGGMSILQTARMPNHAKTM